MNNLFINTDFIKLSQALKLAGLYISGGEAKDDIEAGLVFVNGSPCLSRGKKLYPGDSFSLQNKSFEIKTSR